MKETLIKTTLLEPCHSARPSGYMQFFMRLQAEHEHLKKKCEELSELSSRAATTSGSFGAQHLLHELSSKAKLLLQEMDAHAKWEDEEVFPLFTRYYKKKLEPTILPSLWVLEKDHELAIQFFESFLQSCNELHAMLLLDSNRQEAKFKNKMKMCCDSLTQGCLILTSHFQMEEELIYPLAEEILTDMDYLFS